MRTLKQLTLKELNHLFNNPLGYLFCGLLPASLAYFLFWQNSGTNIFVNGTSDLRLFFRLAPFFLAIFAPLLAMRAWSEEKRQGTMEWLLALPLTDLSLVWAKFLAPMIALVLTLLATLPFALTLSQLGGLDWGPVLSGYLGLVLFSSVALGFSLWVSSTTQHQILSFLFSFLIFSFFAFFENSPLNLNFRLQQMAQGLVALKDIFYFLSLTGFFLFLNIHFLHLTRKTGTSNWFYLHKTVRILIVAALFIIINALTSFLPLRMDWTKNGLYTLSDSTKEVLSNLDEEVHLKLFFSQNLPTQFQPVLAFIDQMVDEYEAQSSGKLQVIRLHPDQDEKTRNEALGYGIKQTAGNVTQQSRVEVVKIWFGMVLTQGDRKVVFPTMQDIPNLEYDLTTALLKLQNPQQKKVILAGPKPPSPFGHDPKSDLSPLIRELSKQFDILPMSIYPDKTESFEQGDALLVWGVHEFTEDQLKELDRFVLSGKPVMIFSTGVSIQIVELTARDLPPDMADSYFEHLGFKVGRNLVQDNSCQRVQSSGTNRLMAEYPLFPLLNPLLDCFPQSWQPLVSLNSLTLPWTSTIEPVSEQTSVLLQTSKQAWLQERMYELDPEKVPGPTSFERFPLGILIQGPLYGYFESDKKAENIKVVALGTHHVLGQYQNPSTINFISNTLNYWCAKIDLSDIEKRQNAFKPLPANITFKQKRHYQLMNLLTGPLCFSLAGLIYFIIRRKKRYRVGE